MREDFAAIILSHGRPDKVETIKSLRTRGYTGRIIVVADDQDPTLDQYRQNFGDDLMVFCKQDYADNTDPYDNFERMDSPLWARNASFDIAKNLGLKTFVMLDDDYYWFGIRGKHQPLMKNLDDVFQAMSDFVMIPDVTTISFSQGGDHIGGFDGRVRLKRKAMNSFFCAVDKPFKFESRLNDDVSTYVVLGARGNLFFTITNLQLDQSDTQSKEGGLTQSYLDFGTYVKSFYSVMSAPSCVTIKSMGEHHHRLHHSVKWRNAVPLIIHERHRKAAKP